MSLRSVGDQLLQTVPNALLAGATTASLSFWFRVNHGSNVVNPNGVQIFGDSGGKISATLSGSGSLSLGWLSHNGTTNGGSSCALTLVPGTNYHIAAVWQNAAQSYYLNGALVRADTQVGSIGVAGDNAPHSYRIGSDSAGTDVTLDEPTLWVGYALTAQDVLKLRDRAAPPQSVATPSIALQWSLAGADGVAAKVGDPGLADTSTAHLNLSSIIGAAPTYQAGALSYYPPVKASIAPSGESIVFQFQDGSGNPVDLTSIGLPDDTQTIGFATSPAGNAFTLTFNGQTTAPIPAAQQPPPTYALWTIPTVVGHTYSVAVTIRTEPGYSVNDLAFELLDPSQAALSTIQRCESYGTSQINDGQTNINGSPILWDTIGPLPSTGTNNFVATGTHYYVRCSADSVVFWLVDGLRVHDVTASTVTYQDDQDGSLTYVPTSAKIQTYTGDGLAFKGTVSYGQGSEMAPIYGVTGGAAAVQSALLALSNVTAGGLTVTGSNPYTVQFGGPMGGALQPTLTATDGAITVRHSNPGGNLDRLSINGGSPIPLNNPIWSNDPGGYQCVLMYPLHQDQTNPILGSVKGPLWYGPNWPIDPLGSAVSGVFANAITSGGAYDGYITFYALVPGTYQIAATWPTNQVGSSGGSVSTHAVFNLLDANNSQVAGPITVDQTAALTDYTSGGHGYKVLFTYTIVAGGTDCLKLHLTSVGSTGTIVLDSARLVLTSADNSVRVNAGDTLSLALAGGRYTTSAGLVSGQALTPVNAVGGSLFPTFSDSTPATLDVGFNIEGQGSPTALYSNVATQMITPFERENGSYPITSDANGYPTLISKFLIGGSTPAGIMEGIAVVTNSTDPNGSGKGLVGAPAGKWTLIWDEKGTCPNSTMILSVLTSGTAVEDTSYQNIGHLTNNVRVFNLQPTAGVTWTPNVGLNLTSNSTPDGSGNYACGITNLRIYPPNPSDPTGMTPWGVAVGGTLTTPPPKYHPNFWSQVGHTKIFRWLDALNTNACCVADFADFRQESELSRVYFTKIFTSSIASIVPYESSGLSDPFFYHGHASIFVVNTTGPHNAFELQGNLEIDGAGSLAQNNGYPGATFNGYQCLQIHVTSPTQFLVYHDNGNSAPAGTVFTGSLGAGGTVVVRRGTTMPLQDIVEICNGAPGQGGDGIIRDLWLNVPTNATDACVNSIGAYLATNLLGKLTAEYSNECFNFGFRQYYITGTLSYRIYLAANPGTTADDTSYQLAYVTNAVHVQALMRTAFTTASRRATDVVRPVGVISGDPRGRALGVVDAGISIGAVFDIYVVSCYMDNMLSPYVTYYPSYPTMTTGQCDDHWDLTIIGGYWQDVFVTQHIAMLASQDPDGSKGYKNLPIHHYEGSLEIPTPGDGPGNYSLPGGFYRSAQVLRSYRMYRRQLALMESLQSLGSRRYLQFYMQGNIIGGYYPGQVGWTTYYGWGQQPGTGASTENPDPFDMPNVLSQQGGAINHWASLVSMPNSPKPKPKHLIPGRNGQIRTTGYPRGLFRPTR